LSRFSSLSGLPLLPPFAILFLRLLLELLACFILVLVYSSCFLSSLLASYLCGPNSLFGPNFLRLASFVCLQNFLRRPNLLRRRWFVRRMPLDEASVAPVGLARDRRSLKVLGLCGCCLLLLPCFKPRPKIRRLICLA
jgi:hypothetical protein